MAAQGVNTASLGNADQGSGFSRRKTPNIQHPTSNVQCSRRMFGVRRSVFGVRCSAFGVRRSMFKTLLHHSITLGCVTNTPREGGLRGFCARQVNRVSGKI